MSDLLNILLTKDLAMNLMAGAIIFIFEFILITALLPYFVQKSQDRRWLSTRTAAINNCVNHLNEFIKIIEDGGISARNAGAAPNLVAEWGGREALRAQALIDFSEIRTKLDILDRRLVDEMALYSPCYTPELMQAVVIFRRDFKEMLDWTKNAFADVRHLEENFSCDSLVLFDSIADLWHSINGLQAALPSQGNQFEVLVSIDKKFLGSPDDFARQVWMIISTVLVDVSLNVSDGLFDMSSVQDLLETIVEDRQSRLNDASNVTG